MIQRRLAQICFAREFGRQMRFIAGPRQVGKTTLAREFLKEKGSPSFYYNWDDRSIRQRYREHPQFVWDDVQSGPKKQNGHWVCFDEIHKMPKWKNILKGIFDALEPAVGIIVTGSARLDYFRRSGDSLAGRYFLFHLSPISLFELTGKAAHQPMILPKDPFHFIEQRLENLRYHQEAMESLLRWSGFPEPLLKGTDTFNRKWHQDYLERLVREDIRDLTHVQELDNVVNLVSLLPQRIGSPLSLNSLREDLEVSHTAVRNYVKALELTYALFQVLPYSRKIQRSVRKEKKVYFFDWAIVPEGGIRFENYIACELLGLVNVWNDAGLGAFELRYIRTRLPQETDFLIVREGRPWILFEAKVSDQPILKHHLDHARILGNIPIVQLVQRPGITRREESLGFSISASRFLGA